MIDPNVTQRLNACAHLHAALSAAKRIMLFSGER
jgi:hypothetical protein